MTVAELREKLAEFPPDMQCVVFLAATERLVPVAGIFRHEQDATTVVVIEGE
jgi:hypothetical protein